MAFSVRFRQSRMSSPKEAEADLAGDRQVMLPLLVDEIDMVAGLLAGDSTYLRSSM